MDLFSSQKVDRQQYVRTVLTEHLVLIFSTINAFHKDSLTPYLSFVILTT